ncbi:MAG: 16S rRNA (adenine(1518)-N(6)/adenine(1519)-N(6))-dimethyltransferase RsmA [Pontiellaceae bacterium]
MDIDNFTYRPTDIIKILNKINHQPNKRLGQNFLIDSNILNLIVNTSQIKENDNIIEIGPGLGALTERIINKPINLICIEKDFKISAYLKERFEFINIVENDALKVDYNHLFSCSDFKVVANLPYSIASRLMINLAESKNKPLNMCLTVQKEVADKLISIPGDKSYGVLSILTKIFYDIELVKKISPSCFFPAPKVWSAIVKMNRRKIPLVNDKIYKDFKYIVKYCFSQRRKQLGTSLKNLGISDPKITLSALSFSLKVRPQELEIKDWIAITECYLGDL